MDASNNSLITQTSKKKSLKNMPIAMNCNSNNYIAENTNMDASANHSQWVNDMSPPNYTSHSTEFNYNNSHNAALEEMSYAIHYEAPDSQQCLRSPQTANYDYNYPQHYSANTSKMEDSVLCQHTTNIYDHTNTQTLNSDYAAQDNHKWMYESCDDTSSLTSSSGYNSDDYYFPSLLSTGLHGFEVHSTVPLTNDDLHQQQQQSPTYYSNAAAATASPAAADIYAAAFNTELSTNTTLYAAADNYQTGFSDNMLNQVQPHSHSQQHQQQPHNQPPHHYQTLSTFTSEAGPEFYYSNSDNNNGEWNIQMDSSATALYSTVTSLPTMQNQVLTVSAGVY